MFVGKSVCLSCLLPHSQPCHQFTQRSQQARFRIGTLGVLDQEPSQLPKPPLTSPFSSHQLWGVQHFTPPNSGPLTHLRKQLLPSARRQGARAHSSSGDTMEAHSSLVINSSQSHQHHISNLQIKSQARQLPEPRRSWPSPAIHTTTERNQGARSLLSNLYHPPASPLHPLLSPF